MRCNLNNEKKVCIKCGEVILGRVITGMCSRCYQRNKTIEKLPVYELPKKGEIKYTPDGKVVCHICGRGFKKPLNHAYLCHGVTAYDYKKEFGLDVGKGLLSSDVKEKLQESVKRNYDKVVLDNLIKKGEKSRFIKGSEGRPKEKISLQSYNELVKRITTAKNKSVSASKVAVLK